ncbi:MAG: hypothetical protein HWD92_03565 [Flavobacteriia bacterium]|nr:hypothetical protein [Flavobacteriia bacterium]
MNKLWYWTKVVPGAVASIIVVGMLLQFVYSGINDGLASVFLSVVLVSVSFLLHWAIGRVLFKKFYLRLQTPLERYEFLKRSQRWKLAQLYDINSFIEHPNHSPRPKYTKTYEELEPEKIPFTIYFNLDHLRHQTKRYAYDDIVDLEIQRYRYADRVDLVLKNGEKIGLYLSSKEIRPTEYLFFKFIENHQSKPSE